MFTFILFVFLAITFGYFSTQNTQSISVTLADNTLPQIPLFIILGVTLLIGLAFSWIVSLFDSLASSLKIRGKEHKIKDANKSIHELTKQINKLEIENAELKQQKDKEQDSSAI